MAAAIGAVDLHRAIEHDLSALSGKRLTQLVSQDQSDLVRNIDTARELQGRHALGCINEKRDRTEQIDEGKLA